MPRKSDIIKERILNEVLSITDLENIMTEYDYSLIEAEDDTDIIKFTNYKSQIWIEGIVDEERNVLVAAVKQIGRVETSPMRVDPFHSYEDLEKVLNWFWETKHYKHWIVAWLMTALGRRVGDTVDLKWADIYKSDGKFRERLTQLVEEKTGKKVAPIFSELAEIKVKEYLEVTRVNPFDFYGGKIVNVTEQAFRKMLKKAVAEVGITYPVSTHSFRKFWANQIYRIHPQDVDNLMVIQTMLGHNSPEITKIYIGEIANKQDKYIKDYSDYLIAKGKGVDTEISNSPMMVIKAEDFREILSKCWDMSQDGIAKFDGINKLIGMAENCMV